MRRVETCPPAGTRVRSPTGSRSTPGRDRTAGPCPRPRRDEERDVDVDENIARRRDSLDEAMRPRRPRPARSPRSQREEQALDQHLPHQAPAGRPKREPDQPVLTPPRRARQEEVGRVHASDGEDDQRHRHQGHNERPYVPSSRPQGFDRTKSCFSPRLFASKSGSASAAPWADACSIVAPGLRRPTRVVENGPAPARVHRTAGGTRGTPCPRTQR